MKIVLVHPAQKTWTKAALLPLGLAYIAAHLEKNGFSDIEVIDYCVEPKARLPRADIVGITATTGSIKSAWKIAKKAKKKGAVVILGGPHVSALPEESACLPQVDFVCRGEGEKTMLELCQAISAGKNNFSGIKGLCFKEGRRIIHTPLRPFVTNLDSFSLPARHLFKLPLYSSLQPLITNRKPAASLITSRGCPFGCNFCYKGTFGRSWRPRGVKNVLKEWEYLVKVLKVKEIALVDDAFNLDIKRAFTICREIKKRGLVVPWRSMSGIRADRAPRKLLRAMKESGCYFLSFGVESGVQGVVDRLGKQLDLGEVKRTFKNCRDLGILTMAFFMVGNAGETKEDVNTTIDFALKLDPDFAQFALTTPFPGTPLFDLISKNGRIRVKDWDKYYMFGQRGYFDYGSLKAGQVARLAKKAYRRFYLRPKVIIRLLKRKETWLNLPNVIAGGAYYLFQKRI